MKKLLCIFVFYNLILLFSSTLRATVCAETNPIWNYYIENNGVYITKHSNPVGDILIPAIIDGYPVVGIDDSAFYNCEELTSIIILNGVISIGNEAFKDCSKLKIVSLPNSLRYTGNEAFANTPWLDNFSNDFVSINNILIRYKGKENEVIIPDGIVTICGGAFYKLSEVTSIKIPDSVEYIGNNAFQFCRKLSDINLPNKIYYMGVYAFNHCESLTNIVIPDSVSELCSGIFSDCLSLEEVGVPNGVTRIKEDAFEYCRNLINISIPSSVTSIEDNVFNGCDNLSAINVVADNQQYSSIDGILFDVSQTNLVKYSQGKKDVYYEIPDTITTISDYAFSYNKYLQKIKVPQSVKIINKGVFSNCSSLINITIPESVIEIGAFAFDNCVNLAEIDINNNVEYTGYHSFNNTLWLDNNADEFMIVGNDVLVKYNGNEKSVVIPNSVKAIGSGAFEMNLDLTSVSIPEGVTIIGDWAFGECINLVEVNIPNSVFNIGYYAFGETAITNLTFPKNIDYIGKEAFIFCNNLLSATIINRDTYVDEEAFAYCGDLTIFSVNNSKAEKYAVDNNIKFEKIITATFNSEEILFDQLPIIENGRTLVPLRAIFEKIGAKVNWNENTKTVTAIKGAISISIQIDSCELLKNGEIIKLDVSARILNSRTMLPIRAVTEAFGAKVDWNEETKTIVISN